MKNQEIIEKLKINNNFHLSLKVIQVSGENLIVFISNYLNKCNKKTMIITDLNECYEKLLNAYENNFDYVICNENINFLLPLVSIINNDELSIIKPMIPVFYLTKDNKIIQQIKTTCRKKMTTFQSVKNNDELIKIIDELIK